MQEKTHSFQLSRRKNTKNIEFYYISLVKVTVDLFRQKEYTMTYIKNFSKQKAAKRRVDEGIDHREPGWWKRALKNSLNMVSEPRTDCVFQRIGRDGSARYSAGVCWYPMRLMS